MPTTCWPRANSRWLFPFLLAVIFSVLPVAAQTQPSSSQDAETIDQTWQHASSKYDSQRAALVKEARSIGSQGPYRADWQSLQKYEVPDWYKDAKFGIFIHWGVYQRPRLRQRVVPAKYVPSRHRRVQTSPRYLRSTVKIRLQRFHPHVQS